MFIKLPNNPTIVVTGASKGIGAHIAETLAHAGAHVIMISRNEALLQQRYEKLTEAGCHCSYYAKDVTDFEAITEIVNKLDRLDVLVNNAAGVIIKKFEDYTEDDFNYLINLNVKSYFRLSQLAAKKFKQNDSHQTGGMIINISSIMGKVAQPVNTPRPQALYTLAKHAIEGLTKALSTELAPHNIRVNSICPTYVITDLVKETMQNEELRDFFLNKIPLRRFAETRDIAEAVLFLCSSRMITGESLMVDGGWCAT